MSNPRDERTLLKTGQTCASAADRKHKKLNSSIANVHGLLPHICDR